MKQTTIVAVLMTVMIACSGCVHTRVVDHSVAQVVQVAESLAPWSNPPSYKTTEVTPGQEWQVLISENVPGQKFEHYSITFRIVKREQGQTEVTVDAERRSALVKNFRKNAPSIRKRYATRLAEELKNEKPQTTSAGDVLKAAPEK